MPQVLRIGPYIVYFWSNESNPLEPVHVHLASGTPSSDATKIWITQSGKTLLCHNRSRIPNQMLRNLQRVIESNSASVIEAWQKHFGEISYYC
ncbi:MAG: DUF4160 domain-containing protein [Clostridia bacterium]|nr:DUF4160 domain-containing protein [Clostridia bacterium]